MRSVFFLLTSEPAEVTRLSTGSLVKVDVPFVAEISLDFCLSSFF